MGVVVGAMLATVWGQAKEAGLETRVFAVGTDFLRVASAADSPAAADPIGYRPPIPRSPLERWETFRQSGDFRSAKEMLTALGIKFPSGASALFHPGAGTLTVKNTTANLDLVEALVAGTERWQPKTVTITAHLVQATGPLLRLLAANEAQKMDQTQALKDLMKEAERETGAVKILHTAFLEMPRGSRSTFSTVTEHEHATDLVLDAKGRAEVETETQPLGFQMDLDPLIQEDGKTLDIRVLVQHTLLKQPARQETLTEPVSGGPLEMPLAEFETAKISTEVKMKSGHTRLLGLWPVKGDPALKETDVSQGVFLTAHVLSHGAEAPQASSTTLESPDQMIERTFNLPREFFFVNPGAAQDDLRELLGLNGLKLPATSQVSLDEQKRMRVKTTAEMMPVVEGWVGHYAEMFPKTLKYTVEVIRAPAALVREQILKVAHQSNHRAMRDVLREAVGRKAAEQVAVAFAETRPNESAIVESVMDKHWVSELSWQNGQQPVMETERRPSGFLLTLDSYMSGGDSQVSVNMSVERHHALPSPRREKLSDPASRRSFVMPLNEFQLGRIETDVILSHGETRLIGVWRPVAKGGEVGEDVLEAVFIQCDISRHTRHFEVDADAAMAEATPVPAKDGDKMLTKIFKVTPDFILHEVGSPRMFPDPFGKELSAKDLFKAQGIPFPEGAEVSYTGPAARLMTVKNTAANLVLMEAYLKRLNGRDPSDVSFILHLLEIPVAKANEVFLKAGQEADHRAILDKLLVGGGAGVKSLATLNLSVRGKHEHTVENVKELKVFKSFRVNGEGAAEMERQTVAVGTSLTVAVDNELDERLLKVDYEIRNHPAEPVRYAVNLAAEGSAAVEVPLTDLSVETAKGHLTMMSGSAHILALWKPMGRPEFDAGELYHIAILEAHVMQDEKAE